MDRCRTIEFPLDLGSLGSPETLRCSEGVAAAWSTAVSSVGTRTPAMVAAYLRESVTEACTEMRVSLEPCIAALPPAERSAMSSLGVGSDLDGEGRNAWLMLRATFMTLRLIYGD
ncbi:MAG: hypothetical protein AAF721_33030 [Myxococcota bacterium]